MNLPTIALLMILIGNLQAYYIEDDEELDQVQRSLPVVSGGIDSKCKKDILLVLDMSSSIGRRNYFDYVVKFVKGIILSPILNVGPQGSHISLMIFSETNKIVTNSNMKLYDKTHLVFNFGKYKTKSELLKQVEKLDWKKDGSGQYTETEFAMKIANEQVFTIYNPLNWRREVADVVILMTDGEPRPKLYTRTPLEDAMRPIDQLKSKGVQIVTIGTGRKITKDMRTFLQKAATTEDDYFIAQFTKLDSILEGLVGASCRKLDKGDCHCTKIGSVPRYIPANVGGIELAWPEPSLICRDHRQDPLSTKVQPDIKSPHFFEAGDHTILYDFGVRGGFNVPCDVNIIVRSCECPNTEAIVKYGGYNGNVEVTFTPPKLGCNSRITGVIDGPLSFGVGRHEIKYTYEIEKGTFLKCSTPVQIKDRPCGDQDYNSETDVCCCGKAHKKQSGYDCCGHRYYDKGSQDCCPNANLVATGGQCP